MNQIIAERFWGGVTNMVAFHYQDPARQDLLIPYFDAYPIFLTYIPGYIVKEYHRLAAGRTHNMKTNEYLTLGIIENELS